MNESVVIVDRSSIQEGKLDAVRDGMKELAEFAQANEPRMIAYCPYLDEDRSQVTVFQMHPDSASAEFHMQVGVPLFQKFVDLLKLQQIDVYGEAGAGLIEQLQHKADMLGGAPLAISARRVCSTGLEGSEDAGAGHQAMRHHSMRDGRLHLSQESS